jgi:PilZ domain-containing protein
MGGPSPQHPFRESRRSTRVPLRVVISVEGGNEQLTCEGETIIVNLHGALLTTAVPLAPGLKISIQVYLTGKRSGARVAYIDPANSLRCGIELDHPQNIWGVPLPPSDWSEGSAEKDRR